MREPFLVDWNSHKQVESPRCQQGKEDSGQHYLNTTSAYLRLKLAIWSLILTSSASISASLSDEVLASRCRLVFRILVNTRSAFFCASTNFAKGDCLAFNRS